MKNLVIILAAINISLFAWSAIGFFKKTDKHDNKLYFLLAAVSLLCYLFSLLSLSQTSLEGYSSTTLAVIYLFCIFLFGWSHKTIKTHNFNLVFSLETPSSLVKTGPYRYTRNPFYLCYIIFFLSTGFFAHSMILIALSVLLAGIYYSAVKVEENSFLQSSFADEYKDYMKQTKRFIPFIF